MSDNATTMDLAREALRLGDRYDAWPLDPLTAAELAPSAADYNRAVGDRAEAAGVMLDDVGPRLVEALLREGIDPERLRRYLGALRAGEPLAPRAEWRGCCRRWLVELPARLEQPQAGDDRYESATWFSRNTRIQAGRLRHAAKPGRKSMRVRRRIVDGTICYSVADARRWWGDDFLA